MLEVVDSIDREKWSKFVCDHPLGNIFQMPEMVEVHKRTKNYEPISLAVIDDDTNEILALLIATFIKEIGILGPESAR